MPFNYSKLLIGCFIFSVLVSLNSCKLPDTSKLTDTLIEHKTKSENLLHLFFENCKSNSLTYNKGIILYNNAQTQHNQLINGIISDIRKGTQVFDHSTIEEDLRDSYNNFYEYAQNSIDNNCNPHLSKSKNIMVVLDIAMVALSIYNELDNNSAKEKLIEELKDLEMKNYYEIIQN